MTKEQVAAGRELIADIKARHPITKVLKHKDIASTVCPGKNFRWAELVAKIPDPETVLTVGAVNVPARMIEGAVWVPVEEYKKALKNQIEALLK